MPSQPKQPAWLKQKGYLSNVHTDQLVERLAVRPNSHTRQNKSHTPADRRLGGPQTASEYLSTIDQEASTAAFDHWQSGAAGVAFINSTTRAWFVK